MTVPEDQDTKAAAAFIYNINEYSDLPLELEDYLNISRAYFLLEFHNGGPAGYD